MPTITFSPSGIRVQAEAGARLTDVCREAGFPLSVPCGEKGICGKCRVLVLKGDIPVDVRQEACLTKSLLAEGWRAACAVAVSGDLTLSDPADRVSGDVALAEFIGRQPENLNGIWLRNVVLGTPTTKDQRDDFSRLADALAAEGLPGFFPGDAEPHVLAMLPGELRRGDGACAVVGMGRRILSVRGKRDGESVPCLGLAVDLGTTTMAAALCDLETGDVLAVASRANPQSLRGDDVITRIEYASRGGAELNELRALAVSAVEEMDRDVRREAGVDASVLVVALAGNTVMTHLLLGVPPGALAVSPFIPAFNGPVAVNAALIGWRGGEPPLLLTAPNIAAYVGGDITAGLLAHDVEVLKGNTLFLDVGTNGEIVLYSGGRLYACAAAAGPAFEGARIRQGMRAAVGAVSHVRLGEGGGLETETVEKARPARGICGTGLLDAVAALLRTGLVDESGRMLDAEEAAGLRLNGDVASRLHADADGNAYWLEWPSDHGGPGVALTARDVREFQLAKGAVAAGVRVLLEIAGIAPGDLDRVFLAGGFGSYLNPEAALAVGLLPAGVPLGKVRAVGNASLAGARLYLLSEDERRRADEIADRVEYVELSGRDDFQIAFAEEMLFPER